MTRMNSPKTLALAKKLGKARLTFPAKSLFESQTEYDKARSDWEETGKYEPKHKPIWRLIFDFAVDGKNWVDHNGTKFHVTKLVGKRELRNLKNKKYVTRKQYNKLIRVYGKSGGVPNFPQRLRYGRG